MAKYDGSVMENEILLVERRQEVMGQVEAAVRSREMRRRHLAVVLVASFLGASIALVTVGLSTEIWGNHNKEDVEILDAKVYWNGYIPQFNVSCDNFDDDTIFSADTCSVPDSEWFCAKDCVEGSACYDVCGSACEDESNSWGALCLWEAWANLPDLCAGTFTPSISRKLINDRPPPSTPIRTEDAVSANGVTCAWHAYCSACDLGSNEYCTTLYHTYFNATQSYIYTGNEQAAAALESDVLASWCDYFDLPYTPIASSSSSPVVLPSS